jgi:hypothetical protein
MGNSGHWQRAGKGDTKDSWNSANSSGSDKKGGGCISGFFKTIGIIVVILIIIFVIGNLM